MERCISNLQHAGSGLNDLKRMPEDNHIHTLDETVQSVDQLLTNEDGVEVPDIKIELPSPNLTFNLSDDQAGLEESIDDSQDNVHHQSLIDVSDCSDEDNATNEISHLINFDCSLSLNTSDLASQNEDLESFTLESFLAAAEDITNLSESYSADSYTLSSSSGIGMYEQPQQVPYSINDNNVSGNTYADQLGSSVDSLFADYAGDFAVDDIADLLALQTSNSVNFLYPDLISPSPPPALTSHEEVSIVTEHDSSDSSSLYSTTIYTTGQQAADQLVPTNFDSESVFTQPERHRRRQLNSCVDQMVPNMDYIEE